MKKWALFKKFMENFATLMLLFTVVTVVVSAVCGVIYFIVTEVPDPYGGIILFVLTLAAVGAAAITFT